MKVDIKHDERAQAVYIRLREARHSTTKQIDEDVIVDIGEDGRVIGIEINDVQEVTNLKDA